MEWVKKGGMGKSWICGWYLSTEHEDDMLVAVGELVEEGSAEAARAACERDADHDDGFKKGSKVLDLLVEMTFSLFDTRILQLSGL